MQFIQQLSMDSSLNSADTNQSRILKKSFCRKQTVTGRRSADGLLRIFEDDVVEAQLLHYKQFKILSNNNVLP